MVHDVTNVLTYGSDVGTCPATLPGGLGSFVRAASSEAVLQEQAIGFLTHSGARVAYAVTGSGPPLLVDLGRAHHLEAFWAHPPYRHLVQRLARRFTVVRWDRPGFGLSDRGGAHVTPGADVALVERLADALGTPQVALLAGGDAGPHAIRFAARHADRVSRLALFGTAAQGRLLVPDLPAAAVAALATAPAPAIHAVVAAAAAKGSEPEVASWLAWALEVSAGVPTMVELVTGAQRVDATPDLAGVRAPTLVLHRERDAVVDPRWARSLAATIPGAELVGLAGTANPAYAGDTDVVAEVLARFLWEGGETEADRSALSPRELEVAGLLTLGLTNAEISRRLAIRVRTVDAHLEHIRTKLGVTSRARIAAWAVRHHGGETTGTRAG
jgi:pimeloyl-ACP methyl ester carboxylesterase/DNA-binding CsgD family transcriptional regulator